MSDIQRVISLSRNAKWRPLTIVIDNGPVGPAGRSKSLSVFKNNVFQQLENNSHALSTCQFSAHHVIIAGMAFRYHVLALSGKPLARQAHSLLWFWSLLLISARADVNDLLVCVGCWEWACSTVVCVFGFSVFPVDTVGSRLSSNGRVLLLLFPRNMLGDLLFWSCNVNNINFSMLLIIAVSI